MAARRLIITMLVLLGISTALAVVAPAPKDDPAPEEVAPPAGATGATGARPSGNPGRPDPGLVEASISAGDEVTTVKASPGDRLVLSVDPGRASDVEIPGLGLTGTTTAYAPATFDVRLPDDPGEFEVVEVDGPKLALIKTAD